MQQKLFMIMLGATPPGRLTEQHDIFFGIGASLKELVPQMQAFWPEAQIHIDAWREVTRVDGFSVEVIQKQTTSNSRNQLFFVNLGGYRKGEFEEYHYKILTVSKNLAEATKFCKSTAFYAHFGFKGAESHIDDKYGIAVDDIYKVTDILPAETKAKFSLAFSKAEDAHEDALHIGYVQIAKLLKS